MNQENCSGIKSQNMKRIISDIIERAEHFKIQGGAKGYFSECADLTLYLIQHSKTPDRFKSTDEFSIPGQMKLIGDLTFPSFSPHDFYEMVGDFYTTQRPLRNITPENVANLMENHQYHLNQKGDNLRVSNIDGLTRMLTNCL